MKKIAMFGCMLMLAILLTGCASKPFTCYMCGKEKTGKRYEGYMFGEKATLCAECNQTMNELGKAMMGK